nr:hypothetical protein [Tanacetum cinerariifolium]
MSIDANVEERKVVTLTYHMQQFGQILQPVIPFTATPQAHPAKPTSTIFALHTHLEKINFIGWVSPHRKWEDWVKTMKVAHGHGWKRAGIYDAIMNSTLKIPLNKNLIFWFAEKWSPKTNTFILPWGEITITLEDMMVLGGLSVLGDPVTSHLESLQNCDALSQLNKAYKKLIASPSKKARFSAWMNEFMDNQNVHEHEAFRVLWLSKYLFPFVKDTVLPETFNLAIRLVRGQKLALAPAVLATLYRDLHLLQNIILDLQQGKSERVLLQVFSPMYYMQVWVLERFPLVRPYTVGNVRDDETRLARWANPVNKRIDYATLEWDTCGKQFVWRPYVKDTDHFIAHTIYKEYATIEKINNDELESFARCVRVSKLVGLDISQQYFPHRVSRQFGYNQDIPAEDLNLERSEDYWDEYIYTSRKDSTKVM